MLLHKTKQRLLELIKTGKKALRLIPSIILGVTIAAGATAGQSASLQDFDLGHLGQELVSHIQNSLQTTFQKPAYSLSGNTPAAISPVKTVRAADKMADKMADKPNDKPLHSLVNKISRNFVRGMQQPANEMNSRDDKQLSINVLDSDDEKNYRALFTALNNGDLSEAEALAGEIRDGTLLGEAQAGFLLHPRNPNVRFGQLAEWLQNYSDLPQAQDIYKKAASLRVAGDAPLSRPPVFKAAAYNNRRAMMAETVEWKKPRGFTAENLWRTGQYDAVLEKIGDEDIGPHASFEAYYPHWIKGLSAFALQDYVTAARSFSSIAQADIPDVNRAAAAFWAARSFEKTQQTEQANYYYAEAAKNPHSYYGMLALARVANNDASVLDTMQEPSLSAHHIAMLKQDKAGMRALALLQIGEKDLALKELQTINGKPELQDALEALSDAAQLPLMVQTPNNSRQASRYPVMPWRPIGGFTSDPALVMAIAWNESRFEPLAHNPSGARGIMQIMPGTAERITVGSSGSLFNAQANVTLGDQYISKLSAMNGIDGNLLLIIAGYNCGPGKVQELYNDARHGKDPLLFIESMPLKETRDYVQKVLATYAAYRVRLGKPLGAIASLSRGEWPSYDAVRTASR